MFRAQATDGAARAGLVGMARGEVVTPCFMPVGTRGALRLMSAADLDLLRPQVVLANTYHLMLRPGAEVVAALGGLPGFTGWPGHFLTDSGGFQVMSLPSRVDDDGVDFRSSYDGSWRRLTPESAVAVQQLLGADIQMVLDVCTELPAGREVLEQAGERTLAWAARARDAHPGGGQQLFGIVQGGTEVDLRAAYARSLSALGFDGYGIGGLAVGEPPAAFVSALAATLPELPADRPRYLMGVGDPWSVVVAIGLGVDMFDCVLPTRLGRHGTALTSEGKLAVKAARYALDDSPVDRSCPCPVCARHSRAYLRHLYNVGEPTAGRLVSLHNVAWLLRLCDEARQAVVGHRFAAFAEQVAAVWAPAGAPAWPAEPEGPARGPVRCAEGPAGND